MFQGQKLVRKSFRVGLSLPWSLELFRSGTFYQNHKINLSGKFMNQTCFLLTLDVFYLAPDCTFSPLVLRTKSLHNRIFPFSICILNIKESLSWKFCSILERKIQTLFHLSSDFVCIRKSFRMVWFDQNFFVIKNFIKSSNAADF